MNNEQQVFKKWFLDHAKAPIDPWHKEFAWSVWQARAALASAPEAGKDNDYGRPRVEQSRSGSSSIGRAPRGSQPPITLSDSSFGDAGSSPDNPLPTTLPTPPREGE